MNISGLSRIFKKWTHANLIDSGLIIFTELAHRPIQSISSDVCGSGCLSPVSQAEMLSSPSPPLKKKKKTSVQFILVLVLLTAQVKRFSVSDMRDFCYYSKKYLIRKYEVKFKFYTILVMTPFYHSIF